MVGVTGFVHENYRTVHRTVLPKLLLPAVVNFGVRFESYVKRRKAKIKGQYPAIRPLIFGRSDRIRTCGIDVPNVARYQLRHTPADIDFAVCLKNSFSVSDYTTGSPCGQGETYEFQKISTLGVRVLICYNLITTYTKMGCTIKMQ